MERMRWANEVTPLYSCLACVAGDEKENNEKGLGREEKRRLREEIPLVHLRQTLLTVSAIFKHALG